MLTWHFLLSFQPKAFSDTRFQFVAQMGVMYSLRSERKTSCECSVVWMSSMNILWLMYISLRLTVSVTDKMAFLSNVLSSLWYITLPKDCLYVRWALVETVMKWVMFLYVGVWIIPVGKDKTVGSFRKCFPHYSGSVLCPLIIQKRPCRPQATFPLPVPAPVFQDNLSLGKSLSFFLLSSHVALVTRLWFTALWHTQKGISTWHLWKYVSLLLVR